MIDTHCHILFGIDDGAQDLEESMRMCSIASSDGIKIIIATPHYIDGMAISSDVHDKLAVLNEELKKRSMELSILPGSEIYLGLDTYEHLHRRDCPSLNNSRYVLVEFSMMDVPRYVSDALYNLRLKGYVPIIAHPERNVIIMEKPELVYDFVMEGCLIQINSTSLTGLSGKGPRKAAELLLKHRLVHFIASDAHSSKRRVPVLSGAWELADKLGGAGTAERLMNTNPRAVIDDAKINFTEPIKFKKKMFDIFGR